MEKNYYDPEHPFNYLDSLYLKSPITEKLSPYYNDLILNLLKSEIDIPLINLFSIISSCSTPLNSAQQLNPSGSSKSSPAHPRNFLPKTPPLNNEQQMFSKGLAHPHKENIIRMNY